MTPETVTVATWSDGTILVRVLSEDLRDGWREDLSVLSMELRHGTGKDNREVISSIVFDDGSIELFLVGADGKPFAGLQSSTDPFMVDRLGMDAPFILDRVLPRSGWRIDPEYTKDHGGVDYRKRRFADKLSGLWVLFRSCPQLVFYPNAFFLPWVVPVMETPDPRVASPAGRLAGRLWPVSQMIQEKLRHGQIKTMNSGALRKTNKGTDDIPSREEFASVLERSSDLGTVIPMEGGRITRLRTFPFFVLSLRTSAPDLGKVVVTWQADDLQTGRSSDWVEDAGEALRAAGIVFPSDEDRDRYVVSVADVPAVDEDATLRLALGEPPAGFTMSDVALAEYVRGG